MDIPVNVLSIRAVYWRKMFQDIPNIHICELSFDLMNLD